MFKELSSPIYLQWEVTPLCNYKCIHCYNAWRNKDFTLCNVKPYQKIVNEIIDNKIFFVTITGGEPIIVFEEILPYLRQLREADIEISLNTNASLITNNIAYELKKLGVKNILVSVPSGNKHVCNKVTQYSDSLTATMAGIYHLLYHNISVSINMVITSENIETIYETAKLFKDLPISSFSATRAATPCDYESFTKYRINNHQFEYMFDELLRVENDFHLRVSSREFYPYCAFTQENHFQKFGKQMCSAGKTEAMISYDGSIKACPHASKSYGNVDSGFIIAWKAMNQDWRTEKMIPEACLKCSYRIVCAGGCKQEAYNCYHMLNAIDPLAMPICKYEKANNEKTVFNEQYEINKRLKARKEYNNNILLYTQINKWMLVNEVLGEIILSNKKINLQLLIEKLHISEKECEKIISVLLSKKIICEVVK